MSPEQVRTWQEATAADLVDRLVRFEGPPQEFLRHLLAVQCRLAEAEAGVILRIGQEGDLEMVAVYPPPSRPEAAPPWVGQVGEAAGNVFAAGKTAIAPLHTDTDMYGDMPDRHLILVPIRHTGRAEIRGVSAFLIHSRDPAALRAGQERLELSSSLLSLYEMQLMLQRRALDMSRLRDSLEVIATVNQHDRFRAAAMGLCNEFASRWSASRVSLGFLRGRGIRLLAISHTENFSRKMQLVQDIEAAMEECLDQDVEVLQPAPADALYVSRAAGRLSERQGPSHVCSFPLRHGGDVPAVLTVERPREQPFDGEMIESMRLAVDLATARLVNLHEHDRWFGAKLAHSVRKGAAGLIGPKHTWVKLLVLGIVALILFFVFAKGEYSVRAPFVLQAQQALVVPVTFDGTLDSVEVDLGQEVKAGQVLARLATAELQTQLVGARAELSSYQTEILRYRMEGKQAEVDVAEARAAKAQAVIDDLQRRLRETTLTAPVDGRVVRTKGDLRQQINATFQRGDVLFEVAPLERLRAELDVDEKDVHELRTDPLQAGELAIKSEPGRRVRFTVQTISPVAEMADGQNVFKVRVQLEAPPSWMKPGMTGYAHVSIGRRRYAWIWTRRIINWIRLKLWL